MGASDAGVWDDTPETDETIVWPKKAFDSRKLRSDRVYRELQKRYRFECANRWQADGSLGEPCIRCHEPIDYQLRFPHPLSWSLEHLVPVTENPALALDRNNFASSHFGCNSVHGATRVDTSDIGVPSKDW
ncbi:hypothetical protein [Mycobacterium asiaticum]|uniref:hypothetical protein n=1 Tax=Mycobacterium asiaticum TaxID=1790 RepID=UPI0007EF2588|nr:hypothetical protein [Mycobacterium asiaticum]OBJ53724.1 hypothetical protein A9W94_22710 [Mycobacterium asiaticum]